MHGSVLTPIGFEITDLPLGDANAVASVDLPRLLADHGFVVLRGQQVDDATFIAFLEQFGDLAFTKGETPVVGFPNLNVVSNVGRDTPPRSVFHSDTSYVRQPPTYTALRVVEVPAQGGATLFTNQYRAFETLSPAVRASLQGRTITHTVSGVDLGDDDEQAAEHPALRRHPISGRTALYISTPERCVAISGMGEAEAQQLIAFLYRHSTAPHNIYRHAWVPGDVVMWDNGCVLHRADHADVVGDRVMHRGMVATTGSFETGAGNDW